MRKTVMSLLLLLVCAWTTTAHVVTGRVSSGRKCLAGVIVSDGKNFALTDSKGEYKLDVDGKSEFVFVVTPSGYVADWSSGVPAFYRKSESDRADFDLIRMKGGRDCNIVAVADPQPRKMERFKEFMGAPLTDIVQTASSLKGQTVGIVLGDICFDAYELMPMWKKELVRTGVPFYPVVGNHDHDNAFKTDKEAITTYRSHFGPENYAFFLGEDLVVVLDNIIYDGGGNNYTLGYADATLDWLEGLMQYVPEKTDVFVAQHSPVNGRRRDGTTIVNYGRFSDILKGRELVILSGHNHVNVVFEHADNVIEHNVGALCGAHWDTYHCADGSPSGYKVLTKSAGKLTWYYKSIYRPADFQMEVFEPGMSTIHPEALVANVWDYDSKWKVEWYQDGECKGNMEMVEDYSPLHAEELRQKYEGTGKVVPDYRKTKRAGHYFRAFPSQDAESVTVEVTDRFGRVYKEQLFLKDVGKADSLAFVKGPWQITELERGAQAMYAQLPVFGSMQSISVVKYPAARFRTEILHRPGDAAVRPGEAGKELGAAFVMNGGYFHVKERIPSVFFKKDGQQLGYTHPTELYRVNGMIGFRDEKGREPVIVYSPDSLDYSAVSKDLFSAMSTGPLLILDGKIVVPELMGDKADGDNVAAMEKEKKEGGNIRTHYTSAQFYDRRHPRTAIGTDDEGNIYLVVIDGRFQGWGDGASIYETAYICRQLGMTNAINLDGGGSSALWTKKTGVLSHPRDNKIFDHEGERVVPNLVVVY